MLCPREGERFILDDFIPRRYQTVLPRIDAGDPQTGARREAVAFEVLRPRDLGDGCSKYTDSY